MAHFAQIDQNGVVQRVIVAEQDFINTGVVGDSFNWIQTSYNDNFRKQFAPVGGKYLKANDVFVQPQPYPSWTLDENFDWQPPVALPADAGTVSYDWDEAAQLWVTH